MSDPLPEPGTITDNRVDPIPESTMRWVKPILKAMSRLNVAVYKASNGRVGGRFPGGAPVCLLTVMGKKSRKPITIPLIYVPNGEDVLLVASQGGMPRHPGWYYSITANPEVTVQYRGEVREMVARRASDQEKRELWGRLLEVYPPFDEYQRRTERNIAVFVCSPR